MGLKVFSVLRGLLDQSDNDHDKDEDGNEAAEDDDHGDHPVQFPLLADWLLLQRFSLRLGVGRPDGLSEDQPAVLHCLHVHTDESLGDGLN